MQMENNGGPNLALWEAVVITKQKYDLLKRVLVFIN